MLYDQCPPVGIKGNMLLTMVKVVRSMPSDRKTGVSNNAKLYEKISK